MSTTPPILASEGKRCRENAKQILNYGAPDFLRACQNIQGQNKNYLSLDEEEAKGVDLPEVSAPDVRPLDFPNKRIRTIANPLNSWLLTSIASDEKYIFHFFCPFPFVFTTQLCLTVSYIVFISFSNRQ